MIALSNSILVAKSGATLVLQDAHSRMRLRLDQDWPDLNYASTRFPLSKLGPLPGADDLFTRLQDLGWLSSRWNDLPPSVIPLRNALAYDLPTECRVTIATQNSALLLGSELTADARKSALRRFASLLEWQALQHYAPLTWRPRKDYWTWGDLPTPEFVDAITDSAEDSDSAGLIHWTHQGQVISRPLTNELEIARDSIAVDGRALWSVSGIHMQPNLATVPDSTVDAAEHRWCMGVDFNEDMAEIKMKAESFERYTMGNFSEKCLMRRAAGNLMGDILRPSEVLKYSQHQRDAFHLTDYADDEEEWWVRGAWGNGRDVYIPAALVFCPFPDSPPWLGPGFTSSNGVAAHTSQASARRAAWLELNERDAVMRMFLSMTPPDRITSKALSSPAQQILQHLASAFAIQELAVVSMYSSLGVPAVACLAYQKDRFMIGASCKPDPDAAIIKSLSEILLQAKFPFGNETPDWKDIATPEDHGRAYANTEMRNSMLWALDGAVVVDMPAIPSPVLDLQKGAIYYDWPDLGSYDFVISRAIDTRLLPLTFGQRTLPEMLPTVRRITEKSRHRLTIPHPFP